MVKTITDTNGVTFTVDYDRFCMEIDHWHPANTRWNRFKAWLGIGKKPELRRVSVVELVKPSLIFDKMPKEPFPGTEIVRQETLDHIDALRQIKCVEYGRDIPEEYFEF